MNKSILLLFISILTFSCNTTQNSSPTQIGHEISDDDGSKVPLYAGSMSTIEVWENYITAHNNGDIEAVRNLNAIEILLDNNANVNQTNEDLPSALSYAVFNEDIPTIQLLLNKKRGEISLTYGNRNIIDEAEERGGEEIVQILNIDRLNK